ncbi:hypothetical protein EMIT0P171_210030 [Pseudomonas sp. IT-P171]
MSPKEYDLKGITLGVSGRATTRVANEIVNGGCSLELGVRVWRLVLFTSGVGISDDVRRPCRQTPNRPFWAL